MDVLPPSRSLKSELRGCISQCAAERNSHGNAERLTGASPELRRHNDAFRKNLVTIDHIGSASIDYSTDVVYPVGAHTLDGLSSAIVAVGGAMNNVRRRHSAFMGTKENRDIEVPERYRNKNSKSMKQRMHKEPFSVEEEHHSGERSIKRPAREDELEKDPDDTFHVDASRAQSKAMQRFIEIDEGKVDKRVVFDGITSNYDRVKTKLEYFRERNELVLPPIEEQFMKRLARTGGIVVDVAKLQLLRLAGPARSARSVSNRGSAQCGRRGFQTARELGEHSTYRESHEFCTATDSHQGDTATVCALPVLSHASSKRTLSPTRTLSPCSSLVSLRQRADRLAEMWHIRDLRIEHFREMVREKTWDRRYKILDELEKKNTRKQTNDRYRVLFTSLVLAMATKEMLQNLTSYLEVYSTMKQTVEKEEELLVRDGTRAIKRFTEDQGHLKSISDKLVSRSRRFVVLKLEDSWNDEVRGRCKKHAYQSWCHVMRLIRFCVKLLRRTRLNGYAEMIKHLINTSWRGYQVRASMKTYLKQVKLLQMGFRAAVKLRRHIRQNIFLPMVWEAETTILGEVVGMPQAAVEQEIDMHRAIWDPRARMAEARNLSHHRFHWTVPHSGRGQLAKATSFASMSESEPRYGARYSSPRKLDQRKFESSPAKAAASKKVQRRESSTNSPRSAAQPKGDDNTHRRNSRRRGADFQGIGRVSLSLMQRNSHPMMEVIDKYRLPNNAREQVVRSLLKANTERWYTKFKEYKQQHASFVKSWHTWRRNIKVLGPERRSSWPLVPLFPAYPCELLKVDEQALHAKVIWHMKQTEAGQLL